MALKPQRIICHHSFTKDSSTVSWGAIRRYHTENLNFRDIGYHAGVEMVKSGDELYYEILMGRMWDVAGAHTRGQNEDSLGICFVGNFDDHKPPQAQLIAGAKVISLWLILFDLTIGDVHLHREYADKSCPGRLFSLKDLKDFIF